MSEDDVLARFGLPPQPEALEDIRVLLAEETRQEAAAQGRGDTLVMRLLCLHLFAVAHLDDVLRIWAAKTASMDADASIDIQLLCGAGVAQTKQHLADNATHTASLALERIEGREAAGDFDGFAPGEHLAACLDYYAD